MTGWSFEYIDEAMTLPRYEALHHYWANRPPVHLLKAAELGLMKGDERPSTEQDLASDLSALAAWDDARRRVN